MYAHCSFFSRDSGRVGLSRDIRKAHCGHDARYAGGCRELLVLWMGFSNAISKDFDPRNHVRARVAPTTAQGRRPQSVDSVQLGLWHRSRRSVSDHKPSLDLLPTARIPVEKRPVGQSMWIALCPTSQPPCPCAYSQNAAGLRRPRANLPGTKVGRQGRGCGISCRSSEHSPHTLPFVWRYRRCLPRAE